MRRIVFFGWMLLFATSLFAGTGSGDKWGELLRRYGSAEKVKPGAWVSYRIHTTEDGKSETLDCKIACVGEEKVDGKDGMWLEVEMDLPESDVGKIISKSLVVGDLTGTQTVEKVIIQAGDQPPMEMTVGKSGMQETVEEPPDFEDLGEETITVPAGKFTCRHLRTESEDRITDVYISDEVSLYSMVKMESGDEKMELLKYGATGAVSQIQGEPVNPMDMQQLMKNMKDFMPPDSEKKGK